mmetsp:Transcript_88798/g.259560  ORF Transcript_88798/g.259560 Transcript_88798/m.259560 type:complete len:112 (-) Transcript_88798:201-536(-)
MGATSTSFLGQVEFGVHSLLAATAKTCIPCFSANHLQANDVVMVALARSSVSLQQPALQPQNQITIPGKASAGKANAQSRLDMAGMFIEEHVKAILNNTISDDDVPIIQWN